MVATTSLIYYYLLEIQRLNFILLASLFSSFHFISVYSILRTKFRDQWEVTDHTVTWSHVIMLGAVHTGVEVHRMDLWNDLGFSLCAMLSVYHMVTTSDDRKKSEMGVSADWCVVVEHRRLSLIRVTFVDYQTSKLQYNY